MSIIIDDYQKCVSCDSATKAPAKRPLDQRIEMEAMKVLQDASTQSGPQLALERRVSFGSVEVREFNRTAGDHPDCREGPPMSLDWKYVEKQPISVDHYELEGRQRRSGLFALSSTIRKEILAFGFLVPVEELVAAEKAANKAARGRTWTLRRQQFARRLLGRRLSKLVASAGATTRCC